MGVLDKFKFWKRESSDDLLGGPPVGLGQPTGLDLSPMPGAGPGSDPVDPTLNNIGGFGAPQQPAAFQDNTQYQQQDQHSDILSQKLEVISGKLDLIKAGMDSLNQRLEKIENIANEGRKGRW